MRIAALVKQIPQFETMALGEDGRLIRAGLPLEMNAYCRRAVAKAVDLAAADPASSVTVITLGPPSAEDVLREAVAWALQHRVTAIEGVLVTDPACAGSDTIATARALAAALTRLGPFDLVLCGRNSIDADTGQVGPQLAEILDLPFAGPARQLEIDGDGTGAMVRARVELDDGHADVETRLPAVVACAERLCEPSKVDPDGRAAVDQRHLHQMHAADLGSGPWGQEASRTHVGPTRVVQLTRDRWRAPELPLDEQVGGAVARLAAGVGSRRPRTDVAPSAGDDGQQGGSRLADHAVVVLVERDRPAIAAELLGAAAQLAGQVNGAVIAIAPSDALDCDAAGRLGADTLITVNTDRPDEFAPAVANWARDAQPLAVLAPSTMWGRETSARLAVRLDAGLTGDAIELELAGQRDAAGNDRSRPTLVAWKPAFGGAIVAAISATSATHLVTVRPGMLAAGAPTTPRPPVSAALRHATLAHVALDRVRVLAVSHDDDLDTLANAAVVVGVGRGVAPEQYGLLDPLCALLGATLAATRKVTDNRWLPRARQIGITGRSIAPDLYVSIAANGAFNHSVGYRNAGLVLAINRDAEAPVFETADTGIVGEWSEVVPLLTAELARSGLAQVFTGFSGR